MKNRKKLNILFVLQTPWGTNLGMSKVHHDLKVEFENIGHHVDFLDSTQLYAGKERAFSHLFGKSTQNRILDFLKLNAHKYDVIDANQRCVPYPKDSFDFKGVLLYRSHGFQPLYRIAEQSPFYTKMNLLSEKRENKSFKSYLGNIKRYIMREEGEWALWDSIYNADIVHVLNSAEYDYLKDYGVPEDKLILIPNGIEESFLEIGQFDLNKNSIRSEITFLGSWTIRKGILHLPEIALDLKSYYSQLNLLGTGNYEEVIKSAFSNEIYNMLNIRTHFFSTELPDLLTKTKVGISPSYIEGFGLSIVEFLSLGIPVVAFDIPGPADILKSIDDTLVIKLGDIESFKNKIKEILSMPNEQYIKLRQHCFKRAQEFSYSNIATQFLDVYYRSLEDLGL